MILSSFLLFEEDSNCFLLFLMFSVAFHFIWLFGNVSNFLKVVFWLLRKPFRLFTLLRFFKFNCFRLFWGCSSCFKSFVAVSCYLGSFGLFLVV